MPHSIPLSFFAYRWRHDASHVAVCCGGLSFRTELCAAERSWGKAAAASALCQQPEKAASSEEYGFYTGINEPSFPRHKY